MRRNLRGYWVLFVATLALLQWSGCGDDENGKFGLSDKGLLELEVQDSPVAVDDVYGVDVGLVGVGAEVTYAVRVRNVGTGVLNLADVTLNYSAPDGGDDDGAAFRLEPVDMPIALEPPGRDGSAGEVILTVVFKRQDVFLGRTATLVIDSDSREHAKATLTFVTEAPSAVAQVSPPVVDFGTVKAGGVGERFVTVRNTGNSILRVTGFVLEGHPDITLHVGEESYPVSEITLTKVELPEPVEINPDDKAELRMTFTPETDSPASGQLVLYGNDAKGQSDGHVVVVVANQNVPCVTVTPQELLWGGKVVGTKHVLPVDIANCGAPTLNISGVRLTQETDSDFTLFGSEFAAATDCDTSDDCLDIDPAAPFALGPNETVTVEVLYFPSTVSPLDADNQPILDTGILQIENNSFEGVVEVPLSGAGVEVDCPVAIVTVEEGEQVVPQTVLHLKGDQSYSPGGLSIKDYEWSVTEAPEGNASIFIPSASFDNPVYEVNIAGSYTFCLNVRDDVNADACELSCITVLVIPDEAIHVELIWSTAADEDAEDTGEGNGTDMDLHFAHPFASGPDIDGDGSPDPWFDEDFDCFWFNTEPNWGTFTPDVDDDPGLDRDDIDGWGPENLNINIPENVVYRIGVHYWNDYDFGDSLATIRIYVYGELVEEVADVLLQEHDFWNFGEINWTPGQVTTTVHTDDQGAYFITPNYQNSKFLAPQ